MQTIDLAKFAGPDVIVLSGRPMGVEMRKKLALDDMDAGQEVVHVKVPDTIVSLNSSFLLGLFAPSVQKLGETNFRSKYIFQCRPAVLKDIDSGIQQAMNTANPLKTKK